MFMQMINVLIKIFNNICDNFVFCCCAVLLNKHELAMGFDLIEFWLEMASSA
jgi:hypothetical protein